MVLIFGGAYQGKLDYALERFGLTGGDVYDCNTQNTDTPSGKRIINGLDRWIYALVAANADTAEAVERFAQVNPDGIVICRDISCGVVPIEAEIRAWREAVGRALALLSRSSGEVIRVFCGLPQKLK